MSLVMQKSHTANSVMSPRGVTRATEPGVRNVTGSNAPWTVNQTLPFGRGRNVVWIATGRQPVVLDGSESGRRLGDRQTHNHNQAGSNNDAPFARA